MNNTVDGKAAKQKQKMERKNQQKEEMKMWRDKLNELATDERREQLAFPSTLDRGQRKKLHTYAHSIGLKSKSHGTGKFTILLSIAKHVLCVCVRNQIILRIFLFFAPPNRR